MPSVILLPLSLSLSLYIYRNQEQSAFIDLFLARLFFRALMEVQSRIATAFFLLFLLVTPAPCLTRGLQNGDPEVYEIDYRGPETHSYLPPPDLSAGSGRYRHHHRPKEQVLASKGRARLVNTGKREKRTHGHG